VARRKGPSNRYELITCAWEGHVLVGTEVAVVTADDGLVVREWDGMRWCRCLRCDAWLPTPVPGEPTMERVPPRHEIDLPLRGPALRDRYVLRLIACDRALHVIILTLLAIAFLTFAWRDKALHDDYQNLMNALNGGGATASRVRGVLGYLGKAFHYSPTHLVVLAVIFFAFAAVEAVEAVGLWWNKRWAEYLTFIVTSALIPYEIYELTLKVSVLKVVAFVLNVLVVAYLLFAKRLFGVRGGHAAEAERKRELSGWRALEESLPDGVGAPTS
jgi:uncharacterized membrane protein (DUF2068 family)